MLDITYDFYKEVYGGSAIEEVNFLILRNRIIAVMNGLLLVDIYTINESDYIEADIVRLKTAVCASMDCASAYIIPGTNMPAGVLSSESISGVWSKSYATQEGNSDTLMRESVLNTITDFLNGTPFLSRGYFICG